MLARIGVIRRERKKLEAAQALADAAKRAEAVALLIDSPIPVARGAAVVALGDCGPEAMPVIDRLLADPKRTPYHGMLVKQLGSRGGCGGGGAADAATRTRPALLDRGRGPTLSQGMVEREEPRSQATRTSSASVLAHARNAARAEQTQTPRRRPDRQAVRRLLAVAAATARQERSGSNDRGGRGRREAGEVRSV